MSTLSEAQQKWLKELGAIGGDGKLAAPRNPLKADEITPRSGLARATELTGGAGNVPQKVNSKADEAGELLPTNRLKADSEYRRPGVVGVILGEVDPPPPGQDVKVPTAPGSVQIHDWKTNKSETTERGKVLKSPEYIDTFQGITADPDETDLGVKDIHFHFSDGRRFLVPMESIWFGPGPLTHFYRRKDGVVYPLDPSGNLNLTTNTAPNVVIAALWVKNEIVRLRALRVQIGEMVNAFSKIIAMNSILGGWKNGIPGKDLVPKGNNVVGRGPGGKGVNISPPGTTPPSQSAYTGEKGTSKGSNNNAPKGNNVPNTKPPTPGTPGKPPTAPKTNNPTGGTGNSPKGGTPTPGGNAGKPANKPGGQLGQVKQDKLKAHTFIQSSDENQTAGKTAGASMLNKKYGEKSQQEVVGKKVQAELDSGRFEKDGQGGKRVVLDMGEETGWVVNKSLKATPVTKLDVRIDSKGGWHYFPTDGTKASPGGAPKGGKAGGAGKPANNNDGSFKGDGKGTGKSGGKKGGSSFKGGKGEKGPKVISNKEDGESNQGNPDKTGEGTAKDVAPGSKLPGSGNSQRGGSKPAITPDEIKRHGGKSGKEVHENSPPNRHVFEGDATGGYHSKARGPSPSVKQVETVRNPKEGVYEIKFKRIGPDGKEIPFKTHDGKESGNTKKSTMFPEGMTEKQVLNEVYGVMLNYKNKPLPPPDPTTGIIKIVGKAPNYNFDIQIMLKNDGHSNVLLTFHPLRPKGGPAPGTKPAPVSK